MIICHQHQFIFIKTRKTAGTSIELALSRICSEEDVLTPLLPHEESSRNIGPQNLKLPLRGLSFGFLLRALRERRFPQYYDHLPARRVRAAIGSRLWERYTTFCVVRNPFDLAVSHYYWHTRRQDKGPRPQISFSEYLSNASDNPLSNYPIYTDRLGRVVVSRVLRFETLADDFGRLWRDLDLPGSPNLPRAKTDTRPDSSRDYRNMYTERDREVVSRICHRELELFGYCF